MNTKSLGLLVSVASSVAADTFFYEKLPGGANDVGVGANGSAWVVARGAAWADSAVYRWDGGTFVPESGINGVGITVDADGLPWLVTADGSVYRRTATAWQKLSGKGMDIAAGADGSVWLIGWPGSPAEVPVANSAIYRWTGSAWVEVGGAARRIAVDATGSAWIVTGTGDVFRRSGETWAKLPGRGSDIACGPEGSVWLTGYVAGGLNNRPVYRWNGTTWEITIGEAYRLAVAPDGLPWVVTSGGDIFRMHRLEPPQLASDLSGITGDRFAVQFPSQNAVTYWLHRRSDFNAPWNLVRTAVGNGQVLSLADDSATAGAAFYRVEAAVP